MPRIKKGPNKYWSKDEKLRIMKRIIEEEFSETEVAKLEKMVDYFSLFSIVRKL